MRVARRLPRSRCVRVDGHRCSYAPLCVRIVGLLNCVDVGGYNVLDADYGVRRSCMLRPLHHVQCPPPPPRLQVRCDTEEFRIWRVLAYVAFAVFLLGDPLLRVKIHYSSKVRPCAACVAGRAGSHDARRTQHKNTAQYMKIVRPFLGSFATRERLKSVFKKCVGRAARSRVTVCGVRHCGSARRVHTPGTCATRVGRTSSGRASTRAQTRCSSPSLGSTSRPQSTCVAREGVRRVGTSELGDWRAGCRCRACQPKHPYMRQPRRAAPVHGRRPLAGGEVVGASAGTRGGMGSGGRGA